MLQVFNFHTDLDAHTVHIPSSFILWWPLWTHVLKTVFYLQLLQSIDFQVGWSQKLFSISEVYYLCNVCNWRIQKFIPEFYDQSSYNIWDYGPMLNRTYSIKTGGMCTLHKRRLFCIKSSSISVVMLVWADILHFHIKIDYDK